MSRNMGFGFLLSLGLCFVTAGDLYAVPIFGSNLVVNGDAEHGIGSATGHTVVSVPVWDTVGNFTVVRYDAGGGFPISTDPGPSS